MQQGFAQADHIVTCEYRTQVQTHVPMETHGLVADWRDEELTLYASTQYTLSVRDDAASVFGLPKEKIRVISEYTGGGFGAKFGIGNYGALASTGGLAATVRAGHDGRTRWAAARSPEGVRVRLSGRAPLARLRDVGRAGKTVTGWA